MGGVWRGARANGRGPTNRRLARFAQIAQGPIHSIHVYTTIPSRKSGAHRTSTDVPSFSFFSVCTCLNLLFLNRRQRRKRSQDFNPTDNSAAFPTSDLRSWHKEHSLRPELPKAGRISSRTPLGHLTSTLRHASQDAGSIPACFGGCWGNCAKTRSTCCRPTARERSSTRHSRGWAPVAAAPSSSTATSETPLDGLEASGVRSTGGSCCRASTVWPP